MSQDRPETDTSNIVVFGQTGAGKSSLINMLAGKAVAGASSTHYGYTTTPQSYDIQRENRTYRFWDTCGLNEGEAGSVPAEKAIEVLVNQFKDMSVSLIIYIVRGRFTDIVRRNYNSFCRNICSGKAPTVLVVTGLEQEEDIDGWWTKHESDLKRMGLTFEGHACVATLKGRNNTYEALYHESADKVWRLVKAHCDPAPRAMPQTQGWDNPLIEITKKVFFRY